MGTVVLSIDAELGWGFHDLETPPEARVSAARYGWRTLVNLLDEYRIPATWAVVGHLFLEDCDHRHESHPAPPHWFESESERWVARPDLRFARGLVEDVADAAVDHEIGSHSFSHVVFGDEEATREIASAEVERSVEAARARGHSPDSFVFPRNSVDHRDVLAENGFTCYRGTAPDPPATLPFERPLRKLVRATVPGYGPPVVQPVVDEYGLVNVPASMFLYGMEGAARALAKPVVGDPIVRQVRRGVDAVTDGDGVFHVWLHPNNLVGVPEIRRLRTVLEILDRRRDATALTVETMGSVAERELA